jgi:type VI secretion system protein ImpE
MKAREHFEAGRIKEAIAAAVEEVRQRPSEAGPRWFLVELLLFTSDWERADGHLETLGRQDAKAAEQVAVLRQLLRAEQARQQFFTEGRLPEFLEPPSPALRLHLDASIRLREGQPAEAARLLAEAEAARPRPAGTCDGKHFDDFRDSDDLTACFFEVLTKDGKYYWIPTERVESVELQAPRRAHELLWRPAHVVVRDGPDGEVYLPALYPGAAAEADDRLRLGRLTEWRGGQDAPTRGVGQRVFQVGDEETPFLEIRSLTFDAPAGAAPAAPEAPPA